MAPTPMPAPKLPPPKEGAALPRLPMATPTPTPALPAPARFEPAAAFAGARQGMVFKMGDEGLGYYTDAAAARAKPPPVAAAGVVTAVTVDHSRSVVRLPSPLVRAPLAAPPTRAPPEGCARAAVEPLQEPCGRRVAVAWRWSAPRRAVPAG